MQNFDLVGEVECVWEVQAICGEGPLWIESESATRLCSLRIIESRIVMTNIA
jgi:hypothetical protein